MASKMRTKKEVTTIYINISNYLYTLDLWLFGIWMSGIFTKLLNGDNLPPSRSCKLEEKIAVWQRHKVI